MANTINNMDTVNKAATDFALLNKLEALAKQLTSLTNSLKYEGSWVSNQPTGMRHKLEDLDQQARDAHIFLRKATQSAAVNLMDSVEG